jgi:nucleoid-associated protein YgaU
MAEKNLEKDNLMKSKKSKMKKMASRSGQKNLGEYTVVSGDSLSAIAEKFYGASAAANWNVIYEANKELIGDNPNMILPGQVLKIPKLPQ